VDDLVLRVLDNFPDNGSSVLLVYADAAHLDKSGTAPYTMASF
jgi:hypothetical protein